MIRCSRVGPYIECTGKITVRKTNDKLYYMQYDFVALGLRFCIKAGIIFPYIKGISGFCTTEFSIMTWFRPPMSHHPNHHKLPTIILSVQC